MWCKNCNIETNDEICPICGSKTVEDIPVEVYWCPECKVPIINTTTQADKGSCPLCGHKTKYMSADLRPVFPEERLLLELLLEKKPHEYVQKSVWAANSSYYIDGKRVALPAKLFEKADTDDLSKKIEEYKGSNTYEYFNIYAKRFCEANRNRLNYLVDEASGFVRNAASKFDEDRLVVSFSGGKDSTVTADLTINALGTSSIVHIFGNTTLEFPTTGEYAERYRHNHPHAIFMVAKNEEQNFMDVCDDIGPPARMMRWCCSMFKTGPITRTLNSLFRNEQILTFYGIRKAESVSRSKYNRIEDDAESVKIQKQTVASPIFFWKDIDIWLYILSKEIDFNYAYRLGYDRVGCWCCPNNNQRAQFLSRIYMPEKSKAWREFLIGFARKIGKPDAEEYVDSGKWKARQGGNGLATANPTRVNPENNIDCPLGELGLIDILDKNKKTYRKAIPAPETIHPWVLMAVMCDQSNDRMEIGLNELLTAKCNIGKTFNLDAITMLDVLHQVEKLGLVKIIRTAGLDVIQLKQNYSFEECVDNYYECISKID